jgi:D-lactate dehydrogenase (cytochrome)
MIRSTDPDVIHPYLKDASHLTGGFASEVVFLENEKEVVDKIKREYLLGMFLAERAKGDGFDQKEARSMHNFKKNFYSADEFI